MNTSAPAVGYTALQLAHLESRPDNWSALTRWVITLLVQVSDEHTVFPSAVSVSDEGDVELYWRGGSRSVEVDVASDGRVHVTSMRDGTFDQFDGGPGDSLLRKQLRNRLAEFSGYVDSANPEWREIFA